MSIKTKLITYPTLAVLAVMAAIWFQGTHADNRFSLSVTWSPAAMPLHGEVSIVISVDGFPLPAARRRLSPWGETMSAAPGAVITLTAVSNYSGTELLDCMIMRNGSIVTGAHDKRVTPGIVTCLS